jgi:nucleotide-binding universal stress UspA family protein
MLPIKTILHPTDFSHRSSHAFQVACSLASDYGANLVIVHVMSVPKFVGQGVILRGSSRPTKDLMQKLQGLHTPDARVEVLRSQAERTLATEILQLAQLASADLIVIGAQGQRELKRVLLGSVAEEVVRKAFCPVLMVAMPPHQRDVLPSAGVQRAIVQA